MREEKRGRKRKKTPYLQAKQSCQKTGRKWQSSPQENKDLCFKHCVILPLFHTPIPHFTRKGEAHKITKNFLGDLEGRDG